MSVPYCNQIFPEYCQKNIARIDLACHELDFPPGKRIFLQVGDQVCYCICGGGVEDDATEPTETIEPIGPAVRLADGTEAPASALRPGEAQVTAAGLDLRFAATLVERSLPLSTTKAQPAVYLAYHAGGRSRQRVLHFEQPVLVQQEDAIRLVTAGHLCPDDRCLDGDGKPVTLDTIEAGYFHGTFWELATRMDPPDARLSGHLLVTEGIVTGDLALVTFAGLHSASGAIGGSERPYVGSRAWQERWPAATLPATLAVPGGVFRSAAARQVAVPPFCSP